VFTAIVRIDERGEPVDLVTLAEELGRRGDLEAVGGPVALAGIMEGATTAANVEHHCRMVQRASTLRQVNRILLDAAARVRERAGDPAGIADELEAQVVALRGTLNDTTSAGRYSAAAVNASDLCTREILRPRPLLGDGVLTAGGFAVLYGKPGLGKSWLGLSLSLALVRGEPWLGLTTPREGVNVGVLQLELNDYSLQTRLRTLGVGCHEGDARLRVVCRPNLRGAVDLLRPGEVAALREWIQRDRLDVLVIDALSRAHTASENKSEELGLVLAAVDALRHETGCAVLLVHHERKSVAGAGSEDDLDALRGSGRLQSDPTLLVRLKLTSGGLRSLVFVKVSEGPMPASAFYRLSEAGLPIVVPSPESKAEANRERVLRAVLASSTPISRSAVEELTGLGRSAVAAHLGALVDEGRITKTGTTRDARYSPTARDSSESSTRGRADDASSLFDNGFGRSAHEASESAQSGPPESSESSAPYGGWGRTDDSAEAFPDGRATDNAADVSHAEGPRPSDESLDALREAPGA
jgi:replicative DNA helicase